MADNDNFRIVTGGTSDNGYAAIDIGDNGNEPIYVRQFSGGEAQAEKFSHLKNQITLLDSDGNTTFPGIVNASSFNGNATSSSTVTTIAPNGTSSTLVSATMANNDYFRICVGGKDDTGWAEIATADNGNEPIYVRQYGGDKFGFTGRIIHEAALLDSNGNTSFPGNVSAGGHFVGTISANDYAELFPRLLINNKEKTYVSTNPGDLIALDLSNNEECYTLANDKSKIIVGVQSDEYAMIIGGKYTNEDDNLKEFIPVSLAGRVKTRVIGKVNIGDYIIPSDIDGCGKAASKNDDLSKSVGIVVSLLDSDNTTKTEHFVKILVK